MLTKKIAGLFNPLLNNAPVIVARLFLAGLVPASMIAAPQGQPILQITAPSTGTIVNPGQTFTVSVTSPTPASFPAVALLGEDPIGFVGTIAPLPGQISITIPSSGLTCGSHILTVEGTPVSAQQPSFATVAIDLERSDFPVTVSAALSPLIFDFAGEQSHMDVLAGFADGTTCRVTASSYVTYASSNTAVATVDSSGLVTAVGPGRGSITVTYSLGGNNNQISIPVSVPPPVITNLSPTSGAAGTSVAIAGTSFGAGQATSRVTFNGTAAVPSAWSPTSITAPVPSGASTGIVAVTVGGVASNGVGFTVTSGNGGHIALVQHTSQDAGTETSSLTLSFGSNNSAANFIAVVVRAGSSGEVITVTDSNGNTYKKAVQLDVTLDTPEGHTLAIYYAENIAGGPNSVTVSNSVYATLRFAILEYSGVATSQSLDVTAAAQGSSTSADSGSATTTASGELLLGGISTADAQDLAAGSGYTAEEAVPTAPNTKLIAEDQLQTAAGATSASGSLLDYSDPWGAVLATFKAAGQ